MLTLHENIFLCKKQFSESMGALQGTFLSYSIDINFEMKLTFESCVQFLASFLQHEEIMKSVAKYIKNIY